MVDDKDARIAELATQVALLHNSLTDAAQQARAGSGARARMIIGDDYVLIGALPNGELVYASSNLIAQVGADRCREEALATYLRGRPKR